MRDELENGMVAGAQAIWDAEHPTPDIICPSCGQGWVKDERGLYEGDRLVVEQPLSQSGTYCAECVVRNLSTDKNLLAWYDKTVYAAELLGFLMCSRISERNMYAIDICDVMRDCRPEDFAEWMRLYADDHEEAFREWLMEAM